MVSAAECMGLDFRSNNIVSPLPDERDHELGDGKRKETKVCSTDREKRQLPNCLNLIAITAARGDFVSVWLS